MGCSEVTPHHLMALSEWRAPPGASRALHPVAAGSATQLGRQVRPGNHPGSVGAPQRAGARAQPWGGLCLLGWGPWTAGVVLCGRKTRGEGESSCPSPAPPKKGDELGAEHCVRVREVWVAFPPLQVSSLHDPEPQFPLLDAQGPDADTLGWLSSVREL